MFPLAGAALPHRYGKGRAVLPESANRANGQSRSLGNLGYPEGLQAIRSGSGDRNVNPRPAVVCLGRWERNDGHSVW